MSRRVEEPGSRGERYCSFRLPPALLQARRVPLVKYRDISNLQRIIHDICCIVETPGLSKLQSTPNSTHVVPIHLRVPTL